MTAVRQLFFICPGRVSWDVAVRIDYLPIFSFPSFVCVSSSLGKEEEDNQEGGGGRGGKWHAAFVRSHSVATFSFSSSSLQLRCLLCQAAAAARLANAFVIKDYQYT